MENVCGSCCVPLSVRGSLTWRPQLWSSTTCSVKFVTQHQWCIHAHTRTPPAVHLSVVVPGVDSAHGSSLCIGSSVQRRNWTLCGATAAAPRNKPLIPWRLERERATTLGSQCGLKWKQSRNGGVSGGDLCVAAAGNISHLNARKRRAFFAVVFGKL